MNQLRKTIINQEAQQNNTHRSLALSSLAEMGSPEQDCGCALCAGRPGPFFVCSRFRHFARLF